MVTATLLKSPLPDETPELESHQHRFSEAFRYQDARHRANDSPGQSVYLAGLVHAIKTKSLSPLDAQLKQLRSSIVEPYLENMELR